MSIRICSRKVHLSARASTTWMPSKELLSDRFPENLILSHDLLEGCHATIGVDQRYRTVRNLSGPIHRRHRPPASLDSRRLANRHVGIALGARTDSESSQATRLSALSRWKIFDNLRRSLVPAALVLLLGCLG